MKLFDRQPMACEFYNKFNCSYGSGNYNRDIAEITLTVPSVIFAGAVFSSYWVNVNNTVGFYFVCSRELTQSEKTYVLKSWNSVSGYTVADEYTMNYIPPTDSFISGGTGSGLRMWNYWTQDELNKANATRLQRETYIYFLSYAPTTSVEQTDFICTCNGVPMVLPDGSVPTASDHTEQLLAQGRFWRGVASGVWNPRLTLSGYYEIGDDYFTRYANSTNRSLNYSYLQWWYLWAQANGDLSTDFDLDTPFLPLPTDFYITVNANSDHEQKGEQSVTFTWTANNSDDTDLSNVDLHFEFSQGAEHVYEMYCGYADESLAVTYRDIVGKLDLPWWKNIIQKLPIVGQQLTNSTIMVNIWWNDLTGDAGKCQYLMEYDGRNNSVSIDKAKDPVTDYWTYLTAEDEDIGQTPDRPENPYDGFDFGGGTDSVNGSALLTTSYSLSVSGAHDFGRWLWGTGFDLEQLKMVVNNPIENVVSCKLFPFSITGTESTVKIGNLTSSVSAYYLPENVARTFDFGTIKLDKTNFKLFGNFLDYAPFTTITIYLPYLGFHELDTDLAMGANIGVKYYVDFVTGACRAIVTATKYSEVLQQNVTKVLQSFDGNIGQDVPITASNRAQVEAGYIVGGAQAIANFASGIGAIATGNVGGGLSAIGNGITGGIQTAMQMYHSYTNGTPSPALSRFDEQRPYLILDSPVYTEPKGFAHQNGHMCNLTYKLANLHGYTVVDNTVDLSSIPCNFEEREKILELLTSGVYL